jgi:DNA-binding NarL/FixJ family response regulator
MDVGERPHLTPRQWRILELLARGRSAAEIARALGVTVATVRRQLAAIYRALPLVGVTDKRVAAAAWYRRHGAVAGAPPAAPERAVLEELRAASRLCLTPLQWRILARLAAGEKSAHIGAQLGLAVGTIHNELSTRYAALPLGGAANQRVAAVLWYLREGQRYHEEGE